MRALRRGRSTWGTTVGLMAATLALCCLLASAAGARVIVDKTTGQKFGIVPPPSPPPPALGSARAPLSRLPEASPTCDSLHVDPNCAVPMTLHGGPVQHAQNDILFFWGPTGFVNSSYVTDLQTWLSSLAAGDYSTGNASATVGNPISVAQQYYDMTGPGGSKNFIPYAVTNAGTVKDTDPFPTSGCSVTYTDYYSTPPNQPVSLARCLTASQLYTELRNYVAAHHLPTGINTEYFILTPQGMGSCDGPGAPSSTNACSISQYCGWHTYNPTTQITYADLPWLSGTTCDVNRALNYVGFPSPNLYTSGIDSVVGTFSHELAETMTDPHLTGWYGHDFADEIGDKCAYQYIVGGQFYALGGLSQTGGGAYYNTTLNGHNYLLQMEYDNHAAGCNQWNTDTQPSAGISPPVNPVSGTPATFSLTSPVDPAGIAYVTWNFGDGTTGRSTGTAPISHTYSVGGLRTATAIVTDNHGNELKLTAPVHVVQGPASIAVKLSTQHPAPHGAYSVRVSGLAIPGGILGGGHRSEVDLFEQLGATCSATRQAEQGKVAAGNTVRIGQWFTGAGAFSAAQARQAVSGQHNTVHFCGYLSTTASVTNARASTFYTTT